MATTLAQQLVEILKNAGVQRIYGIVGDSLNPIVDAVRRSGGSANGGIDWVHVRHEEAAAFAAAAEAQLTGRLAVCAGSCGPGNLHLINGLYDANRSGAPVLAIASHIPSAQIGSGFFQETHPERLFNECSVYNEIVLSAKQGERVIHSAIQHALGLGGVGVVAIPGDFAELEMPDGPPCAASTFTRGILHPDPSSLDQLVKAIDDADTVALFVGEGARGAHDPIVELAERLQSPIGHSLRGKDVIQYDNPYDVGMTGLLGYGAAAEGINDADLLIMLGTDFPYDQFLPDTRTAQIDRAAEHLGRRTAVDIPVHADVLPTVQALLERVQPKRTGRFSKASKFLHATMKRHDRLMNKSVGAYTKKVEKHRPIHPEYAASILDQEAAKDAVFTADTGMCNVWTARYINPLGTRRLIASYLHGSMANALPHAIGAACAEPARQVISMSGDGGLSMLLGELVTIATLNIPVKVVVFNNATLGMVKLEMLVEGLPDFGVDVPQTDYAAVAAALGMFSVRVEDPRRIADAYRAAFTHNGPALVELITDPNALSIPPEVTKAQVFGFATAMSRIVMNGGAGEAVSMARSNLRNIPR